MAPIASVIIVLLVGSRIPVPGIDTAALAEQLAYSPNGAMARFSIFALGVMPLLAVFAYAEIAKLAFPSFARWQMASSKNTFRTSLVIKAIIIVLTAIQGYGVMSALSAMGLVDDAPGVTGAGVVSFVGASAVMIWLADMVRVPNLGNGIWLLLAIPLLGALPREFATSIELTRFGAATFMDWLVTSLAIILAVVMIVVANRLLSGKDGEDGQPISLAVLLWPPILANTVAGYFFIIPMVLAPELFSDAPGLLTMAALALSAILMPLFVCAYYRLIRIVRPDIVRSDIRAILLAVAGIQVLVCVGMGLLKQATSFSFIPSGGMLIACVTVVLALIGSFGGRSGLVP